MIFYWSLTVISAQYNASRPAVSPASVNPFNLCGRDFTQEMSPYDDPQRLDTKWTDVFSFNAMVYTLLTGWQLLIVMSSFAWQLAYVGACCIGCTQMSQFAAIIFVGIFRYAKVGR